MSADKESRLLDIEVVFATAERQELLQLQVPDGTTVNDAVNRSGIRELFPGEIPDHAQCGVWGRLAAPDAVLRNGDRVEIYRDLQLDPREARRLLALQGKSMNQGVSGDDAG